MKDSGMNAVPKNSRTMFRIPKAFLKPYSGIEVANRVGAMPTLSPPVAVPRTPKRPKTVGNKSSSILQDSSNTFSSANYEASVSTGGISSLDILEMSPKDIGLDQLNGILDFLSKSGLPESVPLGSLRLAVLARGREISVERLIQSLEIFATLRVPDHLFFKEVGRFIRSKVPDLTVSQICRILRSHAAVGCHEAELYHPIYERLCSVANKSSLSQLADILHSVSVVESSTFDCLNIAELCLNRYSLSLRETSSSINAPLLEARIVSAMSRMRLLHEKTLIKMIKRLFPVGQSLPGESVVSINNHLISLDCRPDQLIHTNTTTPSSTIPLPTVFGFTKKFPFKLVPLLSGDISDKKAYKIRVAMVAELLLNNDKFLDDLSIEELEKLRDIVVVRSENFREKSACFFDYKGISLDRQSVGGIFSINLGRVLSKTERVGRVLRKR